MSQPSFCEECEIAVVDICELCGKPPENKSEDVKNQIETIGSPGDKASVLLKRYKISERKRILPFPGFKLYSNKNDGNGWQIVEELEEIAAKSNWRKWLFGKEESGFVYYLNTLTLPIKFEWLVPLNGDKYRVNAIIEIKVKSPEYFITYNQGRDCILLDELAQNIEGSAKERLKNVLTALNADYIDFAKCQTDIHARCQNILGDKGLDITSVTMSGEVEVDLVLERLEEDKMKATQQRELLTHQSTEENLTEQHIDNKTTDTALVKSENALKLEQAEIEKKKTIRKSQAKAEVEALEEEWLLTKTVIDISTKAGVAQSQSETKVAVVGIQGNVALEEESAKLDEAKNKRADINIDHALSLHKKSTAHFTSLKQPNESQDVEGTHEKVKVESDKQKRHIKEQVINSWKPSYSKDPLAEVKGFGHYFWENVCQESPVLKSFILNQKLSYIRYEDNYCQDLRAITNLFQILKEVKKLECYSSFSETHIVFGGGKEPEPYEGINNLYADARDELFRELLKGQNQHISVSSKKYIHDREMKLVFSNGAEVKISLSHGLAYWKVRYFPDNVKQYFKEPVKNIEQDMVNSLKTLQHPKVFCNDNVKDTSVTIEAWIPKLE
jgi:hypothetical protein